MAEAILSRFPNLTALTQTSASVESSINGVVAALRAIDPSRPDSLLGPVAAALQGVNGRLSFDLSGLTRRFPEALTVMRDAAAPGSLDFVRSIDDAYTEARSFLENSALAQAVGEGRSLQEVALAILADLLSAFEDRQLDLAHNLIDATALQTITSAFQAIVQFRTDFEAHRAEFPAFLSQQLLGVAPDLLRAPLEHLAAAQSVLAPLQPGAVQAAIGAPRQALTTVFRDLLNAVSGLDPANPNSYVQIDGLLNALGAAIRSMHDATAALYTQARGLIEAHAWDALFSTLRQLLEAITLDDIPTVGDIVHGMAGILDGILARLQSLFGPQELAQRIDQLSQGLQELFLQSPLGQVRRVIREFLEDIRRAIEAVPTQQIQEAVESMLNRVRQEIDDLGLTQIGDTIEEAFRDLETFVTEQINDSLSGQVQAAIQTLVNNLQGLPVQALVSHLRQAITQVEALIAELETSLQEGLDQLSQVVAQLEELSFKPVGDAVTGEINELKARLQRINPDALSDVEKLAIKGALALLQAIDIEGLIAEQVKRPFQAGKDALLSVLDEVEAALGRLRDQVNGFQPQQRLGPLTGLLEEARQTVEGLDGRLLLRPLYEQLDDFGRRLQALSPGTLLTPLEAPYRSVRSAVEQLNPDQLIAPLNALYAQIDAVLGRVDVRPLLDELDQRQRALFANIRQALLGALDGLSLPEPLAGFFGGMRPAIEAMTDAVFQDPDVELRRISLDLSSRFRLQSLFEPLDRAFDELVGMLDAVPSDALVEAVNAARTGIGVGLEALDPRHILELFRSGQVRLAELSPRLLFAMPLGLTGVRAAYQARVADAPPPLQQAAAATLARFDATFRVIDPAQADSLFAGLATAHGALEDALRRRVNALDASGAEEAYGRLRQSLDRVVPDFLRSSTPLSYTQVLVGIHALRPSRQADELERILDRFLGHLRPMQEALEPAINGFFQGIRNTLMLLNPLSLRDAVADLYDAIRDHVRLLDPVQLAETLHTAAFDPLQSALDGIDPALLQTRLDAAFQAALQAVTANVRGILDTIAGALQSQVRTLKTAVQGVLDAVDEAVSAATETFSGLVEKLEKLVFVEILERLRRVIESLSVGFGREVDRVRHAFDDMLAAIPLAGGSTAGAVVG
jgi:hypothetical protein